MRRRVFVTNLGVVAGLTGAGCATVGGRGSTARLGREIIEVKTYTCADIARRDALLAICDQALVPALNRQGIENIGVFWSSAEINDNKADYATKVVTLTPYASCDDLLESGTRLLRDARFMREAGALFSAPMTSPLYDSCESMLLRGFATCPRVVRVTGAQDRLLQLRIYNSYTPEHNRRKISMFEEGGELAIFRECGMEPVFFGAGLAGAWLDNLTYMLGFDNKTAKEEAWRKFIAHPKWQKLKADPQYKDTANKITNILLKPSQGSQL